MSQPTDDDIMEVLGLTATSTTQLCDRLRSLFTRASTHFSHVGDPSLLSIVGQACGYASVCWSDIDKAGEFDSADASTAVTTAVQTIQDLIHGRLVRLLDQAGTAREWNEAIETALKALEDL